MNGTKQNLKEKIKKILNKNMVGILSTVENGKPHARYMTFFNDEFTIYTATKRNTEKVDEIEKNAHVQVLLGYEGEGMGDTYVEVTGLSSVTDSPELKEKLWNEHLEGWFDGPKDPNYVILKINPTIIRILNIKGEKPQELEL